MPETQNSSNGTVTATSASSKRVKKPRRLKSLVSTTAASDMADAVYSAKVDPQSVDWDSLGNFECFSTSPDGSFPKVKNSRSSYIDLKTKTQDCGIASGRVYRVLL